MRAMIFAAGRGERMRPLTDSVPKPLLCVGEKPLIVWHLEKIAALGVRDVLINTSWLADRLPAALGDGSRWGLNIQFIYEGSSPLETGGGMLNALPQLGDQAFLLVNGDVFTDYDFARLPREPKGLAHLVLVDRPAQASQGDFALDADGHVRIQGEPLLTYAGIGIYRRALFDNWEQVIGPLPPVDTQPPRFRLAPLLRAAMQQSAVTGEHYRGTWVDVGTPQRLKALREEFQAQASDQPSDASN